MAKTETAINKHMNEFVLYGGLVARRWEVERDLNKIGVTGPARLGYASKLAITEEEANRYPESMWLRNVA